MLRGWNCNTRSLSSSKGSWHALKFLVRTKKGPTKLKNGNSWNFMLLPTSSTKGGWEGHAESFDIKLRRGTTYLVTRSCIKTNQQVGCFTFGITFGVGTSHRQQNSLDSPRPELGGSHHLPPYSVICACPWHLHPNGFLWWNYQGGVLKLSRFGLPRLWELITSSSDL
jgi:hypothetical protein